MSPFCEVLGVDFCVKYPIQVIRSRVLDYFTLTGLPYFWPLEGSTKRDVPDDMCLVKTQLLIDNNFYCLRAAAQVLLVLCSKWRNSFTVNIKRDLTFLTF